MYMYIVENDIQVPSSDTKENYTSKGFFMNTIRSPATIQYWLTRSVKSYLSFPFLEFVNTKNMNSLKFITHASASA